MNIIYIHTPIKHMHVQFYILYKLFVIIILHTVNIHNYNTIIIYIYILYNNNALLNFAQ